MIQPIGLKMLDEYIKKNQEKTERQSVNIKIAQHIKSNIDFLNQRTDEGLRRRIILEINPGTDSEIYNKLDDCYQHLKDSKEDFGEHLQPSLDMICELKRKIIRRQMKEWEYNMFSGTIEESVKNVLYLNGYDEPFKKNTMYYTGKAFTGLALTIEKVYRKCQKK